MLLAGNGNGEAGVPARWRTLCRSAACKRCAAADNVGGRAGGLKCPVRSAFHDDPPRHPPVPPRHPRDAARLRRARQGGADRAAASGRGDHRGRSLRERPRPAGRAPRAHHHDERPGAAQGADRGREAASGRARDRSHRHTDAAGTRRRRCRARDPDRPRGPPHDGPRRHPPPGGRDAGRADQPVQVLRLARRAAGRDRCRHWLPLHRQAGDEQLRQGPEQDRRPGRREEGLGLRHGRRPCEPWPRDRRRLHRLRLRDHAADGARARRRCFRADAVLRAHRPCAGQRRLCRELAAAPDVAGGAEEGPADRQGGDRRGCSVSNSS